MSKRLNVGLYVYVNEQLKSVSAYFENGDNVKRINTYTCLISSNFGHMRFKSNFFVKRNLGSTMLHIFVYLLFVL